MWTTSPNNNGYVFSKVQIERFWAKVDKTGDCWIWAASKFVAGYGAWKKSLGERQLLAHRVSFFLTKGYLPKKGLVLDHLCGRRECVNPAHLNVTTIYLNAIRELGHHPSRNTPSEFCRNGGHRLSETRRMYHGGNTRCYICRRAKAKVYNEHYREKVRLRKGL